MTHQNNSKNKNQSTRTTFTKFFKEVNLLVKAEIDKLSKKTSNPKRVNAELNKLLGTQSYMHNMLGRIWFMNQLLHRNIFPHEIHVLARKIIYGHMWRYREESNRKLLLECRKIVRTRLELVHVELKNINRVIRRKVHVVDKVVTGKKTQNGIGNI